MSLLLPRIKKIRIKMKALEWPPHYILIFHTVKGRQHCSQGSDLAEIRTHPRCYDYPCYFQKDPIKIEGARVATTQNIDFSNTQGHITPQSEVGSCRNSNSSEMLWMTLLLPRIKKIRIKMKALEWPQH